MRPKDMKKPKTFSEKRINIIRGKGLVHGATPEDIVYLYHYIDSLEMLLNEEDCNDTFGTEGWRHTVGLVD